jgi:SAM-dependent methyltransferase
LPDYYETVARDVIAFCGCRDGRVWVDLGSGAGGLGLALLKKLPKSTMVFFDPSTDALARALDDTRQRGFAARAIAVLGQAEAIPFPDMSVDVVVSRGSFYFWQDRAKGLREIYRILRPAGRAMIGGGLGSAYPEWARKEFIRRRRAAAADQGPAAAREFAAARNPETFRRLAMEADLPAFNVIGEGGLDSNAPDTGMGIWLQFAKENGNAG